MEATEKRNLRKSKVGIVKSNQMDKSITVLVERRLKHPVYGKYLKKRKLFMAPDVFLSPLAVMRARVPLRMSGMFSYV